MLNEWPCEWERKEREREAKETQKLQLSSDRIEKNKNCAGES